MIWGPLVKGRRVPREARVKALSSIFKELQKPNVDPGKHTWIVRPCSEELESIRVGIYGIHDSLSPPDKAQRVLIGWLSIVCTIWSSLMRSQQDYGNKQVKNDLRYSMF